MVLHLNVTAMGLLEEKAKAFAKEAVSAGNEVGVKKAWQTACKWVLGAKSNTSGAKPGPFSIHTIVKFTTIARNEARALGLPPVLISLIETPQSNGKNLRAEKKAIDTKQKERYTLNTLQIDINSAPALIETAKQWAVSPYSVYECIAGLGVLTGRRLTEIVLCAVTGNFEYLDEKHISWGIALKRGKKDIEPLPAPVFGGATFVVNALNDLAERLHNTKAQTTIQQLISAPNCNELIKQRYQPMLTAPAQKLLAPFLSISGGEYKPTMHTTRKIYTALALEFCRKSPLLPRSNSAFITQVLGHAGKASDENYDYIHVAPCNYEW